MFGRGHLEHVAMLARCSREIFVLCYETDIESHGGDREVSYGLAPSMVSIMNELQTRNCYENFDTLTSFEL